MKTGQFTARKRITETYLKRYVWWWRKDAKTHHFTEKTYTTVVKIGTPAKGWREEEVLRYGYELAKRHDRGQEILPFHEVKGIISVLGEYNIFDVEIPYRLSEDTGITMPDTRYVHFPGEWNLHSPDSLLGPAFLNKIRAEREKQRIKNPAGPSRRRNKPVSWRWVEVLDLADLIPNRPLPKPEDYTKLRKARARARQCAAQIHWALEAS